MEDLIEVLPLCKRLERLALDDNRRLTQISARGLARALRAGFAPSVTHVGIEGSGSFARSKELRAACNERQIILTRFAGIVAGTSRRSQFAVTSRRPQLGGSNVASRGDRKPEGLGRSSAIAAWQVVRRKSKKALRSAEAMSALKVHPALPAEEQPWEKAEPTSVEAALERTADEPLTAVEEDAVAEARMEAAEEAVEAGAQMEVEDVVEEDEAVAEPRKVEVPQAEA